MDAKRVGRRIKAFRKLKGYTQVDFAKELGVSLSILGMVERGSREPSNWLLDEIANRLHVDKLEILWNQEDYYWKD